MHEGNNMLFGWKIKRAGGSMTILHTTGKVTDIVTIEPKNINGVIHVIATHSSGRDYTLAAPNA